MIPLLVFLAWLLIGAVSFIAGCIFDGEDIQVSDIPNIVLFSLLGVMTAFFVIIYYTSKLWDTKVDKSKVLIKGRKKP